MLINHQDFDLEYLLNYHNFLNFLLFTSFFILINNNTYLHPYFIYIKYLLNFLMYCLSFHRQKNIFNQNFHLINHFNKIQKKTTLIHLKIHHLKSNLTLIVIISIIYFQNFHI